MTAHWPPVSLKSHGEVDAAAREDQRSVFIESARDPVAQEYPALRLVRTYQWETSHHPCI